jgi:hypothetical protein
VNFAEKAMEGSNAEANGNKPPAICPSFNSNSTSDLCNVVFPLMLGYNVGTGAFANSGQPHSPRLLVTFRLVCFKRTTQKNKPSTTCIPPSDLAPEPIRGNGQSAVNIWNSVEPGTIYGYLDFSLPKFSGTEAFGTGGTTAQRLILVR